MKYYTWCYPDYELGQVVVAMSEGDIIDEYWEYWSEAMMKKGLDDLITKENCIEDWVVVHWAVEVDYDTYMFFK